MYYALPYVLSCLYFPVGSLGLWPLVVLQPWVVPAKAEIWTRRHGSCRGSWDTYRWWDMEPETWILQKILRYKWMLRHGSGDMDLAEDPAIQRYWDMNSEIWILQRILRKGCWDMDLAENPWDTKMLRHETEDVDLVEDPYFWWTLRHESETWILQRILRYEDAETWIGDMDLAEDPEI